MARNTREAALALSTTADIAEHLPSEDLRGQFGPGYTRTPNEVYGLRHHGPGPTAFIQATFPFNLVAGVCGMGTCFFHQQHNKPAVFGSALFAMLFVTAGQLVDRGRVIQGYDLGAATSVGLVIACAQGVMRRRPAETALATVGGLSALSHTFNAMSARRNPYTNPFIMGPGKHLLEGK